MTDVRLEKLNELYVRVHCDRGIALELSEHFSYFVEGYKFTPRWKNGTWDGRIKLFNLATKSIYSGLMHDIKKFCEKYGYTIEIPSNLQPIVLKSDLRDFLKRIPDLCTLTPHQYQIEAFLGAAIENKSLILSPTGSGKSLIIYLFIRFLMETMDRPILLVVPSVSLVEQMIKDFVSYDPERTFDVNCHKIHSGKDKQSDLPITCTTWQSIFKLPKEWFDKYGAVIVDEAHQADAKSITGIVDKMPTAQFRTGLTGTLDGTKSHELFMRGIFGKLIKTVTTKKLMDEGKLAKLSVEFIRLKYLKEECKAVSRLKYMDEVQYIVQHRARNQFLLDLALKQDNNTLLLFNFVDGHGEKLFADAQELAVAAGKDIYLIHGATPVEERERIRALVETTEVKVRIFFGERVMLVPENLDVVLSDGSIKVAKSITTKDDISDSWIEKNINVFMPVLKDKHELQRVVSREDGTTKVR